MKETCPAASELLLYVEGELDAPEAARVGEHLDRCAECGRAASRLRGETAALRSVGETHGRSSAGDCPDEELMAAYADGTLPADDVARLERHISGCGACLSLVADLWAMSGPSDRDAPEAAVAGAVERLLSERRTAVIRWSERSLELVRGFAHDLGSALAEAAGGELAHAFATTRAGAGELCIDWQGEGGASLTGVVTNDGGPSLVGRVTVDGAPARSSSVALMTEVEKRGPESLDNDGRFGPWPLTPGRNVLRMTGLPGRGAEAVELVIRIEGSEES
jgi:anti-sigma factor RsiW